VRRSTRLAMTPVVALNANDISPAVHVCGRPDAFER
jgi:hypothetical protein